MTYNINAPNQSASPALFPTQANDNFRRLKDIVNEEHNFLDTAPFPTASQGIHRRCTFINQATPGSLPAGNGILYSNNDTAGNSQLNWYTAAGNIQITPGVLVVSSSGSMTLNIPAVIFANPGYAYVATLFIGLVGSSATTSNSYWLMVHNTNNQNKAINFTPNAIAIQAGFNGGSDITMTSLLTGSQTFQWVLNISRLP